MSQNDPQSQIDGIYDQVLIVRCQVGDELAFTELVKRYNKRLSTFIQRLMQNADGADDILQDVWFDVFRNIARLQNAGAFRGWLYRIARDHVAQRFRRSKTRPLPLVDIAKAETSTDEDNLLTLFPKLESALQTLNPEHNEVIVLRYLEELSYEEIATVTRCPVGTVRSRLHNAKNALRVMMEKEKNS